MALAQKIFLTTFYGGNLALLATISCVASEFLQQSRIQFAESSQKSSGLQAQRA